MSGYRNLSGYPDPTANAALSNLIREEKSYSNRQRVYICSPYSDDPAGNVRNAIRYCRFAINAGYDPVAPHIYYTQFLRDRTSSDRKLGLGLALRQLNMCMELWLFGDRISSGMEREIKYAREKHIKIRHFTNDCSEVHT